MRIGWFVNAIESEFPRYATTLLAYEALCRGHEVFYVDVDDFSYRPDDRLYLRARRPPERELGSSQEMLEALQEGEGPVETLAAGELDVLMLRNDPAAETQGRWAEHAGIVFGQEAVRQGVLVLNDPGSLAQATNKLYFQRYPAEIRPRSLISCDPEEIKAFVRGEHAKVVLKPLQGSGGKSVFLVREDEDQNLTQMIEAVRRDGYVIAQEYLPAAAQGDVRFFVMNGEPLMADGRYAAFRRVGAEGDMRSNMHSGGKAQAAEVDEAMLRIVEMVRPMLIRDGMFLVGLDIAGDRLMEINVFSPGGLHSTQELLGVNFAAAVIAAIERKVAIARESPGAFGNLQLAVL